MHSSIWQKLWTRTLGHSTLPVMVLPETMQPGVRVGRHARIRRAIIDRDVLIPRGALIGYNDEEDRRRHTVTDSGIVVVTIEDEPLIGPLTEEALRFEAEADRRGGGA